jgi:prepilin-type N-terminal cleavage/methylation domain-containing protein
MNRGFTLLEIVVAVALLGVGAGVALQVFSGGFKNIYRISLAHRAMNHAENVMNEILSDELLTSPDQWSGDLDDDFSFSAEIDYWEPPQERLSLDIVDHRIELLSVVVDIHFKNNPYGKRYRAVCLKSVSLLPEPGESETIPDPVRQLFGIQ